ncbi:MAG: helix-hairpin-helix domain-containing protein [Ignavibacteriae bacterium]|nr:helix-hairpin-helix domain-containing protein [Ignavibacteriota bacterium]
MRRIWLRLVDWLALTVIEQRVVLFLAGALLLGLGIRYFLPTNSELSQFDYRESDSTFAALSAAVKADTLQSDGKLNLNTATDVQLESLPGIGPVLSERIIRHREANGRFTSADELLKIKGITKKRLEQIKDFITIDTAATGY